MPAAQGPVLALFGISGVGKTSALQEVVSRFPELLHLEASALLKAGLVRSGEELRTASEESIRANQRRLAGFIGEARDGRSSRPVVLDAHVVIDNDEGLVSVPIEVFSELGLTAVVFLKDDPFAIWGRRARDARVRPIRDAEQLARHQDVALTVARDYAAQMKIDFRAVDASQPHELCEYIEVALNL